VAITAISRIPDVTPYCKKTNARRPHLRTAQADCTHRAVSSEKREGVAIRPAITERSRCEVDCQLISRNSALSHVRVRSHHVKGSRR
jgi:hypothetical protein